MKRSMKRLMTALVAAAALWLGACSSSKPTIQPPPPTGKFTKASLKGTYAFVTSGRVTTSGGGEADLDRTGSYTADGAGNIQAGGVEDVVNSAGIASAACPISGGNYTVNSDGRGTLALDVSCAGLTSTISFGIVLTSGSDGLSPANDGLMIDETLSTSQASTGSGNFIKQDTAAFATTAVSGTYVFDFSGLDSAGAPASIVGEFSASSGALTSGMQDENDNFQLNSGVPILSASFTSDPSNLATAGRGTVTINGETYAFYIVSGSRVRLISIASSGTAAPDMLTGDAVLQTGVPASVTGGFAFLVGGSDVAGNGLIRVSRFTAAGTTLSNMLLDVNDNANETQPTLQNGTISSYDSATGRGTFSFQQSATLTLSFVFYLSSPSNGVIQEVSAGSTSAIAVDDGSIALQSGSPFTSSNISGTYAMNWSGIVTASGNGTDEEDLLSQVTASNLNLAGTSDLFQFTTVTLTTDRGTGGQINFNSGNGTGDDGKRVNMSVTLSGQSPVNTVVYIVNPQLAFFTNTNQSGAPRTVAGILKAQQ